MSGYPFIAIARRTQHRNGGIFQEGPVAGCAQLIRYHNTVKYPGGGKFLVRRDAEFIDTHQGICMRAIAVRQRYSSETPVAGRLDHALHEFNGQH